MGRRTWTLIAVILGSAIVFLDSTIVQVALPRIGEEVPRSLLGRLEGQSYVYFAYLLSLSSFLIVGGALADAFGRRLLFAIGLAGFGVTSALCGLAPNMELLVLFRVLQGVAGAILVPGSLAIISSCFSDEEQGRAFGIWAGATGATTIFGPALGGVLVSYASWRLIFLINIPLVALGLWAVSYVEESRDLSGRRSIDWVGAGVIAVALGGITYGAIRGRDRLWTDAFANAVLVIGVIAVFAGVAWMRAARNPLVPPRLFRSRNFTVTNISTLLIYGAIYTYLYVVSLHFVGTLGYNELGLGIGVIPSMLFITLLSPYFGGWAARVGPRRFMAAGPVLMGVGLLWLARIPDSSEPWAPLFEQPATLVPGRGYLIDVLPAMTIFGLGLMTLVAPLTLALMRSVSAQYLGIGSAINNAVSRVGPQLAGALLFIAVTSTFQASLHDRFPSLDFRDAETRQALSPLNPPDPALGQAVADAAREASGEAFRTAMTAAALLCFAGAAVSAAGIVDRDVIGDPAPIAQAATTPSPPVVDDASAVDSGDTR